MLSRRLVTQANHVAADGSSCHPDSLNPLELQNKMLKVELPKRLIDGVTAFQVESTGNLIERRLVIGSDKLTIHLLKCKDNFHGTKSSLLGIQRFVQAYPGTRPKCRQLLKSQDKPRTISVQTTSESRDIMIDVSFIDRVQLGPWSHRFDLVQQKRCVEFIEDAAITIFYDNNRSLDLVFPDINDRTNVYNSIANMLSSYSSVIRDIDKDTLYMRYLWLRGLADDVLDLVPFHKSSKLNSLGLYRIGMDDFNTILKMMGAPAKKRMTHRKWREATRAYNHSPRLVLGSNHRKDKITFQECLWLMEDLKRDEVQPSDKIWNDVFGINVSKVSFEISVYRFLLSTKLLTNIFQILGKRPRIS